jgi:hypothetical protein
MHVQYVLKNALKKEISQHVFQQMLPNVRTFNKLAQVLLMLLHLLTLN